MVTVIHIVKRFVSECGMDLRLRDCREREGSAGMTMSLSLGVGEALVCYWLAFPPVIGSGCMLRYRGQSLLRKIIL